MLFEEIHFNSSFEGKEGRAVTESERERTPIWTAEKQKARPPCCFISEGGMRNVLSPEEECRDLEVTKSWTVSHSS